MNLPTIDFKILDPRIGNQFQRPNYASVAAAGLDLIACLDEDFVLEPGAVSLIGTGIAIYIKDPRYAGLILPRSGLGHKHGLILGNSVGLIDADYQGELKVSCWNRSDKSYTIIPGLRLAQLVIVPVITPLFNEVKEFETTTRGVGGFGSTGTH
jgi:dUTP pyrophosphatase